MSKHPIEIIGETQKKYRCLLKEDAPLGGRNRWGKAGEIVLIPKSAVCLSSNSADLTISPVSEDTESANRMAIQDN